MKPRSWFALAVTASALACAGASPDVDLAVDRGLVETVAELKAAEDADLYRFDPPTDVTGENVFRSSFARLERYLALRDDSAADTTVRLAQAIAAERLGDHARAAALYRDVAAASDHDLAELARSSLPFSDQMAKLTAPVEARLAVDALLARLEVRRHELLDVAESTEGPRRNLVLVEVERLDVRTREFMWRERTTVGLDSALAFARSLIETHAESRRALEHMLRLADMYAELARAQLSAADVSGYDFDPAAFLNAARAAARIYAEVATVDGRPEREEARAGVASMEALVGRAAPGGAIDA